MKETLIRLYCRYVVATYCTHSDSCYHGGDVQVRLWGVLDAPSVHQLEGGLLHLREDCGDLLLVVTLCPPAEDTRHVIAGTQGDHTYHTLEGEKEHMMQIKAATMHGTALTYIWEVNDIL